MAFTKVVGAGIHTLSNITSHNVHSSGIITATRFDGPFTNLNITGVATFAGDVSIGGTLTYEDVTNIDSVGLITARDGIFIPDNKKLELGNAAGSGDLKIYHTGSGSRIENLTGTFSISNAANEIQVNKSNTEYMARFITDGAVELYYDNNLRFKTEGYGTYTYGQSASVVHNLYTQEGTRRVGFRATNGNTFTIIDEQGHPFFLGQKDGAVELYHDNSKKFETTASGATVTGDLVISDTNPRLTFTDTDHNPDYHIQVDGGSFEIKDSTNNRIKFQIDSNGHILIPRDDTYLKIGTGSDIQIYHTSNASYIQNGTGPLNIKSIAQDQDIVIQGNDGGSNISMLYFDTSEAGNAEFSGDVKLTDGKKLKLGYSNDLSLGHLFINNSHNGVINNATNVLFIESDSIVFRDKSGEGAETLAQFVKDGSCSLYNNNQKKLETKGYGIDITGGFITTGGSIVQDGGNIKFGTGSDLQIFHDNSNNINVIQCHNGRTLHIDKDNGSENMAKFIPDGAVELYHNKTKKL